MVRRMLLAAFAATPLFVAAGCRHHCHKCEGAGRPSPYLPPPPGSVIGPPTGANTIPPTTLPTTPGTTFIPPTGPGTGSGVLPPPDLVPPRNFGPPPDVNAKPGGPDVLFPDPLPGGP